jgi:hypothetical protein
VGLGNGSAGSGFDALACSDESDRAGMGELTGVGVDLGFGEIGKEKDLVGGDADRSSRVAAPKSAGKGGLA